MGGKFLMTKSNKIMLCLLLAVTLTCAVALTALSVTPALTANADTTETVNFTAQGYSNGQGITNYTGTVITVTFGKGTNNNSPKYYESGTSIRCYANNVITVSAGNNTIKEIAFTTGSTTSAELSVNVGIYGEDAHKWTGSATQVIFTLADSGQFHIQGIRVTYASSTPDPTVEAIGVYSVSESTATAFANETDGRYFKEGDESALKFTTTREGNAVYPGDDFTIAIVKSGATTRTHNLKAYADAACTTEIALTWSNNTTATGTAPESAAGVYFTFAQKPACEHASLTKHDAVPHTCTTDGTGEYWTCDNADCGLMFSDAEHTTVIDAAPVDAAAHTFDETWTTENGKHFHQCTVCSEGKSAEASCSGGEATCQAKAVCSICSQPYGELGAHNYGSNNLCTVCNQPKPAEADYTITTAAFSGLSNGYSDNTTGTTLASLQLDVKYGRLMKANSTSHMQFAKKTDGGYLLIQALRVAKIEITMSGDNTAVVYKANYTSGTIVGDAIGTANGNTTTTFNLDGTETAIQIAPEDKFIVIESIKIWLAPVAPTTQGEFNVTQSFAAVAGGSTLESKTSGEGESATTTNTLYVATNGTIKVVYTIAKNDGINGLQATLVYPSSVFEFVSAESDVYTLTVTGTEATADSIKIAFDGINGNESYNATATGILVTVTYKLIGSEEELKAVTADDFGLTIDQAVVIGTGNAQVNVGTSVTTPAANVVSFDKIKTASVTFSQTTFTYKGTALTAGRTDDFDIVIGGLGEATVTIAWFSDAEMQTAVEAKDVKNVGTYYLKVSYTGGGFEPGSATTTITINPFDLYDADNAIMVTAAAKQATGSAITWQASELNVAGGKLATAAGYDSDVANIYTAAIATHSYIDVGTHPTAVTLTFNDNYRYNGQETLTITVDLVIANEVNSWTTKPQDIAKDFDGEPITAFGTYAAAHGTPTFTLNGEAKTLEELKTAVINAGSYSIVVTVKATGYTDLTESITVNIGKLTIDQASLNITYTGGKVSWSAATKAVGVYDTNAREFPAAPTVTYQIIDGGTFNFGAEDTLEHTATAAGSYTLKVIVGDTTNYAGISVTLNTVHEVKFAEGTHTNTEGNVIEGVDAYATQYVFEGQKATKPADPTVSGYRFDGWTSSVEDYTLDTVIDSEMAATITLTAKWVAVWTITWNNNDNTLIKTETVDALAGTTVSNTTAPDYQSGNDERFHYDWIGWKVGETTYETDAEIPVSGNTTITATFEITHKTFHITFVVKAPTGNELQRAVKVTCDVGKTLEECTQNEYFQAAMAQRPWHTLSAWQYNGTEVSTMDDLAAIVPIDVYQITLTAQHTLSVGKGNVNGDDAVDVNDITLYRQYIVGGYAITAVAAGSEWTTANAELKASEQEGYSATPYFLMSVAKLDSDDEHEDVRDVVVIRMALVGGYGWKVESGAIVVDSGSSVPAGGEGQQQSSRQQALPITLGGRKFEQE